jgi:hypothetical protein
MWHEETDFERYLYRHDDRLHRLRRLLSSATVDVAEHAGIIKTIVSKFLLFALCAAVSSALPAHAQATDSSTGDNSKSVFLDNHRPLIQHKEKPPTARTVTGKVVDANGQPVKGAIVTLTNTKTHEKREFFTKADGAYRFEDVSFTIDYELGAQHNALLSDTRKLSQYDRSAKVVRILQLGANSKASSEAAKRN